MSVIQQRVPSPDGKGTIWVSPLRDIAHFMPRVMIMALDITAKECDKEYGEQALDSFAGSLQAFIRLAADPEYELYDKDMTAEQAWETAKLVNHPMGIRVEFSQWLASILLTTYFNGIREALHPGERALGAEAFTKGAILVRKKVPWWKPWARKARK